MKYMIVICLMLRGFKKVDKSLYQRGQLILWIDSDSGVHYK